jgi:hypothetical protein
MTRRVVPFVVVVMLVLGLSRVLFHGRRAIQLSHQLVESVKERNEGEPNGCITDWLTRQPVSLLDCERDRSRCARFVELTGCMRASPEGRLPDGLQAGTEGTIDWKTADSWLNAASVVFADSALVNDQLCLRALTLSTFVARHGGADGEKVASRLALLALPECARLTPPDALARDAAKDRSHLVDAMGPMLSGFALDGQVRRFGTLLTPEDRAALPSGMQLLASKAPPPPLNPIERNARAAMWARAAEYEKKFAAGTFDIATAVKEWPERVCDPKRLQQAYDEELIRRAATELVLDAWNLKPHCELGTGSTSTVKVDGEDCLLTNQKLQVQLPSRRE